MAATGGGKIRSRRYHIASKPYAKSKQQSGLISRVTDTVKSIVPSWLQKYFNNEDGPEGGGTEQGRDQNCQLSPSPQPPNGNEEGPPVDGRDSPEPSTSNTEPTTSRASLNFQDYVLPRPPLNRSNLHFTPLDASSPSLGTSNSLFSQPSTSSAPGPFTTGFSLVKEIKDNLSQHEDDNISTTSGFSSRASDKDVPTSKTASLPQLWSPEMDRSHAGPQPSQSSMKKPAFNLSVFGTSSNTSFKNTVLNSSQLGDSPFYPGKTTYGGAAAAARSSRNRPGTPYQAPVRRQIKAKPAGAQPCGVTSATARRILQSLERMSSPLADARRIPASASSPLSTTLDSINPDVPHSQAKKKRMDTTLPPVQKLLVPSVASMSGNRSMSFRPTLTPGGGNRPLDKAPAETPTRQSPQLPETSPRPSQSTIGHSTPAYPLSSTPAANSVTFGGGKIKRERSSARVSMKRQKEDEVSEFPDLPTVSLPISTSALPTFSFTFTSPLPASTVSNTPSVTVTPTKEAADVMETPTTSASPSVPFTFSSPIVKATPASTPSFSPSAGFTFSAPVAKGPSISNGKLANPKVAAVKPAPSKSTEDSDGLFKPAKTLKQGSVLDLLRTPGFASTDSTGPCPEDVPQQTTGSPSSTTTTSSLSSSAGFGDLFKPPPGWNCDVCLVQNKPSDTKCVCCMTPQPNSSSSAPLDNKPSTATSVGLESSSTSSATTTGFAAVFAKPVGTWDCDTCLVRNKADAVKCVACETAKPGTGLKTSLTIPSAFSAIKAESAPAPPISTGILGFGDKFKKAEGAWECDTCMIENKAEDTKCVACMSSKPGASAEASAAASTPVSSAPVLGFGDAFKKPEGSWDCDMCLVQNKAADVECVACQTPKPGAKVEPKAGKASSSSAFGSSTSSSGGFKFGTTETISGSASVGFKFGGTLGDSSAASTGFKFAVPFGSSSSETTSQDSAGSSGFKFGGSSEGFKFGIASSEDKISEPPTAASGFKFGTSGGIVFGTGSSNTESKSGFSFGETKPEDKTPPTTTTSSHSTTPVAAPPQEKSDSVTTANDTTSNANPTANTTTTTTAATKGPMFSRLGEPNPAAPAPQAGFIFGPVPTKEPAAPTFNFRKPEEKKEVTPSLAPSGFVFGGTIKDVNPAPATTGGFAFGKPSAPAEQPPPFLPFGKTADTSETATAEPPKLAFTFGQSATDSSTAPKPAFSFMVGNLTNSTTTTASSSSITTPSLFGSGTTSTQAPAPPTASSTFVFGQPAASSSDGPPAKATFIFGQSQDGQPSAPSAAPLNSNATPSPAQPFMFGASASAAAAPPAAAPSFGFGAVAPSVTSASAPSAASSPFTFSSAPSGGFVSSQAPSFGSSFGSPFTAPPSQTPPSFGANPNPNPTPVFGQQTNSTPAFGANANSTSGGGFQFGASGFGATNNTSGVFTFGAGTAASPAPPANPAIPPQTGAAGPGFNFAQAPSFNIGPTKSFTASPAGQQAIAGRKFKMAVRRRK